MASKATVPGMNPVWQVRPSRVAVVMMLAVSVSSAWALTTVSAELSGLGWALTDLDTQDGVAPSITFSGHGYARAGVVVSALGPLTNTNRADIGTPVFTDGGDPAGTYVRSGIDPAAVGGYRLLAEGRALGGQSFDGEARFEEGACCFTLSPHTRVVFTGLATLQVSRSTVSGDFGGAQAALVVVGPGVGEVGQFEDRFTVAPDGDDLTSFGSRSLQVSYLNDTADPLWGGFNARVEAAGRSVGFTSAVPEPQAYAGLLAGLGLLGALRRRQPSAISAR